VKKSVFATAAAAPLETSIATAKRLGRETGLVADLPEDQLDIVTGGNGSTYKFGNNSFQNQQQNNTQNNFGVSGGFFFAGSGPS